VDSRGPAGLYIITDSRITWGTSDHRWETGQKTLSSTRTPDVFGFCGDAYFAPAMLRQIVDQVNAGLLLVGNVGAVERHMVVRSALKSALALLIVFDAGGPIRGETVLKAHADHSAPTGPLCLPEADAGEGIEDVEALACDGSAALVSLLPNAG
jgi:hypothetical protein